MRDVVREAAEGLGEQLTQSGSELVLVAEDEVPDSWDRHRIEQVVIIVLTNAIKYGGGKPIEISLARDGEHAVLRLRDQGIGISADHQVRIFERFERAVSSRNFGGLGLGLWIARQIVEAHGGTIAVRSESGHGAEFTVQLPLAAS